MRQVAIIRDAGCLTAMAHPLRVRALNYLREPASAATIARAVGVPRQKVNFHIKQLEQAGLIRKVRERRTGGFVEDLYQAVARTFVVSPRLTWSKAQLSALRDQTSLRALVALGEDLQRDAVALLDEAAFNGMAVASASIDTDIRFASEAERAKFMKEYLSAVGPLLKRYGAAKGEPYRFRVAIYPDPRRPEVSS